MRFVKSNWALICFSVLSFGVVHPSIATPQTFSKHIGGYHYGMWDGVWYTASNGLKGERLDLSKLIVRLEDKGSIDGYDFGRLDLPKLETFKRFAEGFYVLEIPADEDPFVMAERLAESGDYEYVYFNKYYPVFMEPNDPLYNDPYDPWNLLKINMPGAWDLGTGSSEVIIAIIDDGVDYYHEDLAANIWPGIGYDFMDGDSDPFPHNGNPHGTICIGLAAAVTNNSEGIAGVAGGWYPDPGVRIMVMDAGFSDQYGGQVDIVAATEAADSAAAWGADVFLLPWGGTPDVNFEAALNRAITDHNVVVVAGAGNFGGPDSEDRVFKWPARYTNVISVGASDEDDAWWWSDSPLPGEDYFGSELGNSPAESLDVVAPGDIPIWSADITGGPGDNGGDYTNLAWMTSCSSSHVAGLVALMRSANPSLAWWQVRNILRATADKVPEMEGQSYTDSLGFGRVNAADALMQAKYNGELIAGDACNVDNDTTWPTPGGKFSNVYVEDSVTVAAGATLTILPGTEVLFRPDQAAPVGITVEGRLIAETPWQGHPSVIIFKSAADDPSPGDWAGISTTPEAYVNLMDCTIQHAEQGLMIRTAVNASEARSEIVNGIFEDNELCDVCVEGYAPEPWEVYPAWADIRDCIFDVITSPCGLHFFTNAESVTVWDCKLYGCSSSAYGVYIEPSQTGEGWEATWAGPRLIRNDFDSFIAGSAVHLVGGTECTVAGTKLDDCKWGVVCEDSSSVSIVNDPQRTEFEWCTVGIETRDEAEAVITGAYLDCHRGLYAKDQSKSIVRNTTFDISWIAVDVGWQAEPDLGDVLETGPGMNTFLSNYSCDGKHRRFVNAPYRDPYIGPVMAEMNWWDSDPPDSDCMSPWTVDYSPWLSSDPNNAEASGVVQMVLEGIPAGVGQNYPNPFGNATMISYTVPVAGARVTVRVFDVKGRLIRTLMDRPDEVGRHELEWNGLDDKGRAVASGVYFLRIDIGDEFSETKKMILGR